MRKTLLSLCTLALALVFGSTALAQIAPPVPYRPAASTFGPYSVSVTSGTVSVSLPPASACRITNPGTGYSGSVAVDFEPGATSVPISLNLYPDNGAAPITSFTPSSASSSYFVYTRTSGTLQFVGTGGTGTTAITYECGNTTTSIGVATAATASPQPNETPQNGAICVSVGANGNCTHPITCPYTLPVSIGATANGDPFPAVGATQSVYLCGWSVQPFATSSPTANLVYSTSGSTCAGVTNITGPQVFPSAPAGNVISSYNAQTQTVQNPYPMVQSSPGATICIHNGGTSPQAIFGWVNYNIFTIFFKFLFHLIGA